jgi:type II secretory pathway component GspD/PulD (secretin)
VTGRRSIPISGIIVALFLVGCVTGKAPAPDSANTPLASQPEIAPALLQAQQLYEENRFAAALTSYIEVRRRLPETPGLEAMRQKILTAIEEERVQQTVRRNKLSEQQMATEAMEKSEVPETYGAKLYVKRVLTTHRRPPGTMQKVLETPVTIHLQQASLSAFIAAVSQDSKINIVADANLGTGKALDIELDEVPLSDVFDYVSRNFDVRFYVGDKLIWATDAKTAKNAPLETRVYRLHKGIQLHDSDWDDAKAASKSPNSDRIAISASATELASTKTYLEEIITQFVPMSDGAQLLFDQNTHALFARNTPDNLELIEDIITTLDVTPPQILIEARFVEVNVADLRELGIDWILGSPLGVTKESVLIDGQWQRVNKTQIDSGNLVNYSPYTSDGDGTFPLGPQGAFGLVRDGNPGTADRGVNMTYRGILTQPMFQAVLHALDVSGKGRTLSVPRLTTLNNNPAKLRHGEDLRFFEEFQAQAFTLLDDNNKRYTVTALIPKGKPSLEEMGITLVAVPSVGADLQTISLLLSPAITSLEGFVSYQERGAESTEDRFVDIEQVVVKLPIISRREIQTKVVVESGETVVMGGLVDTVKQETKQSVPFLGSIPLLGKLFQRLDITEQKRNLLVFVTATVVSERGESVVATTANE